MLTRQLAYCLQLQRRFEEAEELFRDADDMNPGDWWTYYQLGWSLYHQQRYEEALTFVEEALDLNPNFTRYNLIARILISGDIDLDRGFTYAEEAMDTRPENWHKVVERTPYLTLPEHTLGLAYMKKSDYEQAVSYLEQAAEFMPDDAQIQRDLEEARQRLSEVRSN